MTPFSNIFGTPLNPLTTGDCGYRGVQNVEVKFQVLFVELSYICHKIVLFVRSIIYHFWSRQIESLRLANARSIEKFQPRTLVADFVALKTLPYSSNFLQVGTFQQLLDSAGARHALIGCLSKVQR
jgi:hypothetical protein